MVDHSIGWRAQSYRAWLLIVGIGALLAGCSAESVRREADAQIRQGHYENALHTYEDGLNRYPDSVALRMGRVTAQGKIVGRMLSEAAQHRARGDDAKAEALLQHALQLYPNDARARDMLDNLARDRRQMKWYREAQELAAKGLHERALSLTEFALKEDSSNAGLLALHAQLESDERRASLGSARLAETRTVSLDFKDASLRSVLDLVTRNSGVNFVIDKDVPQDVRISAFLRQARVQEALDVLTTSNQLAYKIIDSATVLLYPKTPDKVKEYQDLLIRAFYLSTADVKQTAVLLKTMLKVRDPFIDEKLNLIVIRESAETVRLAERLIALQDVPEPEVVMEVQVLEIKKSQLTELGVNYPDQFTLTPVLPSASGPLTLGNLGSLKRSNVSVSLPTVAVNLHRNVDNVHILANPKIRARNREKARVLIGDKLPVITTTGTAANSGFFSESLQYVDVGLKLDVEPDIHLDDEVAIKVGLEVSSLVREIKTSGGSLVYQIGTRAANTVLRLRDGETQLLAGLISNEERSSANRIPGLGDLPLLGRLFSTQRDNAQGTEVVLSITPHIVRNIRRPALPFLEFWSGTENELRSRPVGAIALTTETSVSTPAARTPGSADAPVGQAEPQPPAQVSLALTAPASVRVGEDLTVQVDMRSDVALRGVPLEIAFPPQVLQIIDAEPDAFFSQDGVKLDTTKRLEQSAGRVALTVLRTEASGTQGVGRVATLRFKALAPGVAEVRLVDAHPIALDVFSQAPLPAPSQITVR